MPNVTWRQFYAMLKDAGWRKLDGDRYCWVHDEGGRFMPFDMSGPKGVYEWQRWADRGEVPPSDYRRF